MRVVVHADPPAYAALVRPLLRREEARNNLPLGVLGQVEGGLYDEHHLLTVEEDGAIAGVVLRTPPWPWSVSHVGGDRAELARTVGDHLARRAPLPGEVHGEAGIAAAVADRWAVAAAGVARLGMGMRILSCAEVEPPAPVVGEPRRIRRGDVDLVVRWLAAFERETGVSQEPRPDAEVRRLVERAVGEGRSPLWLWVRDGEPVSLAGIGRPTGSGERVGPVYTPPELRGHGYASALVGRLTADALARGCTHVFLFTDVANPTSNAIYERLGYRHVGDAAKYDVTAGSGSAASLDSPSAPRSVP